MSLQEWMDKTVSVITSDGRNIIGTLKGFDQTINLILEQSHERIYSEDRGVVQNVLGLYIIRYTTNARDHAVYTLIHHSKCFSHCIM